MSTTASLGQRRTVGLRSRAGLKRVSSAFLSAKSVDRKRIDWEGVDDDGVGRDDYSEGARKELLQWMRDANQMQDEVESISSDLFRASPETVMRQVEQELHDTEAMERQASPRLKPARKVLEVKSRRHDHAQSDDEGLHI